MRKPQRSPGLDSGFFQPLLICCVVLTLCSCGGGPPASPAAKVTRTFEFLGARFGDVSPAIPGAPCKKEPDLADESFCPTSRHVSKASSADQIESSCLVHLTTGESFCPLLPPPRIGAIKLTNASASYLDNKLYGISISFDFNDYKILVAALTTKYGKPDSSNSGVTKTLQGDKLGFESKIWGFADGNLEVTRAMAADAVGSSNGRLSAWGSLGISESKRRAKVKATRDSALAAESAAKDLGRPILK